MTRLPRVLAIALFLFFAASSLRAQLVPGTYDLGLLPPGMAGEVKLTDNGNGTFHGTVKLDEGDGRGLQPKPAETMTLTWIAPGHWEWKNAKGNVGDLFELSFGEWLVVGPNGTRTLTLRP